MAETRRTTGGDLPRPTTNRLQRPSWRDSRLVGGVLLVVLATIIGAAVMRHYDDSVQVLQVKHSLVPGQRITAGDVESVKVRIDGSDKTYFSAGEKLPDGEVLREVRPGELLPRSAIGAKADVTMKSVAIPVDSSQSANLVKGSIVDVWVSRKTGDSAGSTDYSSPSRIIQRAVVAGVPREAGGLSVASDGGAVRILVPDEKVAGVLTAVNADSKVNLVPAAGSPLRGQ